MDESTILSRKMLFQNTVSFTASLAGQNWLLWMTAMTEPCVYQNHAKKRNLEYQQALDCICNDFLREASLYSADFWSFFSISWFLLIHFTLCKLTCFIAKQLPGRPKHSIHLWLLCIALRILHSQYTFSCWRKQFIKASNNLQSNCIIYLQWETFRSQY